MTNKQILKKWKAKQLSKIEKKSGDNISSIKDFTAGEEPTALFYILGDKLNYLLKNNPEETISKTGIKIRKKLNYLIKKIGPSFLSSMQVIENRNVLMNPGSLEEDKEVSVPDKPVIWIANHAFKDDTLASILAAKRNAYIMFGSLPQFYNTFDGITAWLNGVVMTNRKVNSSKKSSISKALYAMSLGADLFIFPEGVWNKSPNELMIDFWPGVYRIAKETGAEIIPIIHYLEDRNDNNKDDVIHTVVDEPISIECFTEEDALTMLRDKMASWYYLMMEKYGQDTRAGVLKGYETSKEAWEEHLKKRVATADRYDVEIELCADYRPKTKVRPENVFESIANLEEKEENEHHVEYAKQLVKKQRENDFQRRF